VSEKREWKERDVRFESLSGIPLEALYTPDDVSGRYEDRLGRPGNTRSPAACTRRCTAAAVDDAHVRGLRPPEDTNARFKFLLEQGQTGLSTAFDMPALMGMTRTIRGREEKSARKACRSRP